MYNLPPSHTPTEAASRYEAEVRRACEGYLSHGGQKPQASVLFPPPGVDPARYGEFWAAVGAQMKATGWTLIVQGDHAFVEPA